MMECAIEEGKVGSGHCFQKCQNLKFPTAATKGKLDNRQREKDGEGGGGHRVDLVWVKHTVIHTYRKQCPP